MEENGFDRLSDPVKAAAGCDTTARELAQHDYDPDAVTPTADPAHYRQPQF